MAQRMKESAAVSGGESSGLDGVDRNVVMEVKHAGSQRDDPATGATGGEPESGSLPVRLGPYVVRGLLARGAMGMVYEALDPHLDRTVAVKVLPGEVSGDGPWMERLASEARTLATINHTNVAAIYGLERDGVRGPAMLVLELVSGPTLRERLGERRMGIEEALRIGIQIACGMEAAHERGIVHRDLKPDNVKLTPAGVVKILDFGIAMRGDQEPIDSQEPPVVSGTHGYISPEQYRAGLTDRRADIFAFGCVLFECLSGKRCFRGNAAEEVMLATLDDEPDWLQLPARTPRRVQDLLSKCLQKDPLHRLRDIGDARLELELAIGRREWAASREAVRHAGPASLVAGSLLVGGLLAAGIMTWGGAGATGSRVDVPINVVISEPGVPVCGSLQNTGLLAISPDGLRVVYGSTRVSTGGNRLMMWESARGAAHEITGNGPLSYDPCFSPDGKRLAFVGRGIMRAGGPGETPEILWDGHTAVKGVAWSGGDLVCSPNATGGLVSLPGNGRDTVLTLTVPDYSNGELSHRYPEPLPDGRNILFTLKRRDMSTFDDAEICVLDTRNGTWRSVLRGGSFARWSPGGHLLFVSGGTIFAAPFDLRTCQVTGPRVPVVEGVMYEPNSGAAQFALARESGTLAYVPGGPAEEPGELCWLGPGDAVTPLGAPLREYKDCLLSPDGERIAAVVSGASDSMFVHEIGRGTLTRLTFGGNTIAPAWEPDSDHLVFASDFSGSWALYRTSSRGAGGSPQHLIDLPAIPDRTSVAVVDGRTCAVLGIRGDLFCVGVSDPPEERMLEPIVDAPATERAATVSPDGRWMAYTSDERGKVDVYVRTFGDSTTPARRVSEAGGGDPNWSPDGQTLFFTRRGDDGGMLVISVPTEAIVAGGTNPPLQVAAVPLDVRVDNCSAGSRGRLLAVRMLPPTYRADRVCLMLNFLEHVKARLVRGGAS